MPDLPAPLPQGPFGSPGTARRVAPFGLAALAGLVVATVPPPEHPVFLVLGGALTALIVLSVFLVPWRRLPLGAQAVPPLVFFAAVMLVRHAGRESGSGVGALAFVPVFWLALYGRRRELAAAVVATALVFLVPYLVVGGAAYPVADARRGATTVVVATLIGMSVQQMVGMLHQQRASAARTARQLAVVGDVLRSMQAGEDARGALCKGVHHLSGAAVSVLVEPVDDQLVGTAAVGSDLAGLSVPLRGEASAVVEVYRTGRRLFIGDARTDSRVSPRLRELTRAVSVLYEPVVRRGLVVAVLVAVWTEQVPFDHEHVSAVSLLGVEAAVAIERADLLAALERSARTDSLTGLANRRAWDEQLPAALGAATGPVCLAALDLDRFKSYNDAFGHPAGDGLLRDAGEAWQAQLRSGDLLARYGGEEFLVLLPDCDLESARPVLERLRLATPNGQTVSVGLAQWDGTETARQLMARADAALYAAKREGRDRLHLTA